MAAASSRSTINAYTVSNTRLIGLLLSVFAWVLLTGYSCRFSSDDDEDQDWNAFFDNPVIAAGQAMSGALWNNPSVVEEGGQFVMYLTSNSVPEPGKDVLPYRATSSDSINWAIDTTPLLTLGLTGEFDETGIDAPSVVFFNGEYHMYYTGAGSEGLSGPLSVGHATSVDGLTWAKDPNGPVLVPTGVATDWNGLQVGEPGAVIFNNRVYLYFAAVGLRPGGGTPPVKRTIGLATSIDGYTFDSPQQVLEQGARYPALIGFSGYSAPAAVVLDRRLHLFYDAVSEGPDFVQVALEHAVSSNGLVWVEDDQSIFVRSDFSWTRREIRAPTVIGDNDRVRMWFAGDDFLDRGLWGIGYATADAAIYARD